jgi:hypothetical protein
MSAISAQSNQALQLPCPHPPLLLQLMFTILLLLLSNVQRHSVDGRPAAAKDAVPLLLLQLAASEARPSTGGDDATVTTSAERTAAAEVHSTVATSDEWPPNDISLSPESPEDKKAASNEQPRSMSFARRRRRSARALVVPFHDPDLVEIMPEMKAFVDQYFVWRQNNNGYGRLTRRWGK